MASLRVDVKKDGEGAFKALLRALASAARVEILAVRNCGAANVRALADALRRNPPALASVRELDLSADRSSLFDEQWQLVGGGTEELRRLMPELQNLTSLDVYGKPSYVSSM